MPPPDSERTHTRPQGVFITLDAIYQTVTSIDDKLDKELTAIYGKINSEMHAIHQEISKMKAQLAAQWVVHGILITTIIFLMQKGLSA